LLADEASHRYFHRAADFIDIIVPVALPRRQAE
jgi:hypothetical protein